MSTPIDDAKKAVIFGEDVTKGLDLGSIAIVCELVEIKDGRGQTEDYNTQHNRLVRR